LSLPLASRPLAKKSQTAHLKLQAPSNKRLKKPLRMLQLPLKAQ
jgi:hypothetical protein